MKIPVKKTIRSESQGKVFVDLSINPKDHRSLKDMLLFIKNKFDVKVVGLKYGNLCGIAKELGETIGVKVVCRVELEGNTRGEIAKVLLKVKGLSDVLNVAKIRTLDVARYAAVKKDIDILRFEPEAYRFIDKSQSKLLKNKGYKPIELSLRETIISPDKLPNLLNSIRRTFSYGIDLILVSDATRIQELVHPISMASIAALAGIPEILALSYVSAVPLSVIKRKNL